MASVLAFAGQISERDAGYCAAAIAKAGFCDDTCKALEAGCGISVAQATNKRDWGGQACDSDEVMDGECELCTQPLWCYDPGSTFGFRGAARTGPQSLARHESNTSHRGWSFAHRYDHGRQPLVDEIRPERRRPLLRQPAVQVQAVAEASLQGGARARARTRHTAVRRHMVALSTL